MSISDNWDKKSYSQKKYFIQTNYLFKNWWYIFYKILIAAAIWGVIIENWQVQSIIIYSLFLSISTSLAAVSFLIFFKKGYVLGGDRLPIYIYRKSPRACVFYLFFYSGLALLSITTFFRLI